MPEQHPITPPSELLQLWFEQHHDYDKGINELLIEAAQYGADKELDACCEWFQSFYKLESWMPRDLERLRAARRPKPQSLKEQALDELHISFDRGYLKEGAADTIRRALEQLDD
jgi:hypothetical protein